MSVEVSVPVLSGEQGFAPGEIDFVVPWIRQGQYLFGTTTGGQLIRIDKDSLSAYNVLTFSPHGTHYRSTDFTYWRGVTQAQDKIYVVFATDTQLIVTVVNPNPTPLVQGLDVITMVGGQGTASITNDGSFLYLVRDPDPSGDTVVHRFSLDGNFTHTTLVLTGFARPKKIVAAGGFVYVSGFSVSTNFPNNVGLSWLVQITSNSSEFTLVGSTTFDRGGDPNVNLNDLIVSASDVWVRYTPGKVRKAPINNITSATIVDAGFSSNCTGLAVDSNVIWAFFENGRLEKIDATTNALQHYTLNAGQNYFSNLATDGTYAYLVRYQTGTIVSRYGLIAPPTLGRVLWANCGARGSTGPQPDALSSSHTVDSQGSTIEVGKFNATIRFAAGVERTGTTYPTLSDIYIIKFGPNGEFDWVLTYGGSDNDGGIAVTTDSNNNIIVVGFIRFAQGMPALPNLGGGSIPYPGTAGQYAFIAKYDPNGVHLFSKVYGAGASIAPAGVAVIGSTIYMLLRSGGGVTYDSVTVPARGGADMHLVAFNSSLVAQWGQSWGGSGAALSPANLQPTPGGDLLVLGEQSGFVDIGNGSRGGTGFIGVYSGTNGNHIWSKQIQLPKFTAGAVDPSNGDIVAGGRFGLGTVDLADGASGNGILTNQAQSESYTAGFFVRYNSSGTIVKWKWQLGGDLSSQGAFGPVGAAATSGRMAFCGDALTAVTFDGINYRQPAAGGSFVVIYSDIGGHVWSNRNFYPNPYSVKFNGQNIVMGGKAGGIANFNGDAGSGGVDINNGSLTSTWFSMSYKGG